MLSSLIYFANIDHWPSLACYVEMFMSRLGLHVFEMRPLLFPGLQSTRTISQIYRTTLKHPLRNSAQPVPTLAPATPIFPLAPSFAFRVVFSSMKFSACLLTLSSFSSESWSSSSGTSTLALFHGVLRGGTIVSDLLATLQELSSLPGIFCVGAHAQQATPSGPHPRHALEKSSLSICALTSATSSSYSIDREVSGLLPLVTPSC